MSGSRKDEHPMAKRRFRHSLITTIALGAVTIAAAFFDEAVIAYQTWRHGAPGIARDAPEDARSAASAFWPLAKAICADPKMGAAEIGRRNPAPYRGVWHWGFDLMRRTGSTEFHQRYLGPYRFPGWSLQSVTIDGKLDSVEVRFWQLEPGDGAGPSNYAVYDGDCALVGASLFEPGTSREGFWRWNNRMCFGPGWIRSTCDGLEDELEVLVDVSDLPFEVVETRCFNGAWSPITPCPTDLETFVPPIGHVDNSYSDR